MSASSPSLASPAARPRNSQAHGWPIFLVALLIGVGAHLAGLALFHFDEEIPVAPAAPSSFVHFAQAANAEQDKMMRQAADIRDPRLIYSPTALNYASRDVTTALPVQPRVFTSDDTGALPKADNNFQATSAGKTVTPGDALPAQWDVLTTLGQTANANAVQTKRGPLLRITPQSAGANAGVTQVTWDEALSPKTGNVRWQPASFLLHFTQTGLAGPPLLERSSGVQAVDDDLGVKLKQWYARHRLPPGDYSIEIGP